MYPTFHLSNVIYDITDMGWGCMNTWSQLSHACAAGAIMMCTLNYKVSYLQSINHRRRYSTERGIVHSVLLTRHYSVLFSSSNNKYVLVNNAQLLAW